MDRPARLVIRLFGAAEMTFDGEPWTVWMPPRCLLLLALVAARDERPTRAALAAALWPDELDSDARANLRRHLHELQKSLPHVDGVEWILYEGKSLRWNDDAPAWVDVRAFRKLCADPVCGPEVAAFYRGELLEGVFDESILADRERSSSLHRELLLRLIGEARDARDHATAIRYARELLAVDEWREDALRELMTATYQSGDSPGALAEYAAFAQRLQVEFKTSPTAETTALRDAIGSNLPLPGAAALGFANALSEPARRAWNLPFVGRDDELTSLRSMWTRAARGSGGTAFVSGEAGIGKSRIAQELASLAREQGAHVLRGRTSDPEAAPYQALLDALRAGLAHLIRVPPQTPWLAVLARALPELREACPEIRDDEDPGGPRARERLFDSIAAALAHLSLSRPLCIVLEDLHWAGPASVDALEALARRIGALPVMLLVTYRSGESAGGHSLRALRATLVRERRAAALPLERLGAPDVAKIVESVAKRSADRELDERIAQLSEGNPLFVAQLLEGYRESGTLPDEAAALHSARDAIAVRVERLGENIRSIAQAAATVGQPFACEIVAEVGGWSQGAVLEAFGALMDRSLVSEAGDAPGYAFSHALVAAAFYNELNPEIRTQRHQRIAEILERGRVERRGLGAIARHWELGGRSDKAAEAYGRAAIAAGEIFARAEAVAAAGRAYELAGDDRTRFEAMLAATEIRTGTADLERWSLDIDRLEQAAASLGDEERFAALRMRERYSSQVTDLATHRRVVQAMEKLAARSGEARHTAYAHYARGYGAMQCGDLETARDGFARAVETALPTGEAEEIARFREELIGILVRVGDSDGARAEFALLKELVARSEVSFARRMSLLSIESTFASLAEDAPRLERVAREILETSIRIGDTYNEAKGHMLLTQSSGLQFDLDAMREHSRAASELFVRAGELRAAAVMALNHALLEARVGRADLAIRAIEAGLELAKRIGSADLPTVMLVCRAEALLLTESFDDALATARTAHEAVLGHDEPRFVAEVLTLLGAAEGRCGSYDEGAGHLRAAIARCADGEATHQAAYAISWLIELACDAGKQGDARAYAGELERLFVEGRHLIGQPTFACRALARAALSKEESERWTAAGARILDENLARLRDPADVAAISGLFFNRELLSGGRGLEPRETGPVNV